MSHARTQTHAPEESLWETHQHLILDTCHLLSSKGLKMKIPTRLNDPEVSGDRYDPVNLK